MGDAGAAGAFHLDYGTFLRFNRVGVVLGISQSILLDHCFGSHLAVLPMRLDRFGLLMGLSAVGLGSLVWAAVSSVETTRLTC